jgi:hypothetical protein
MDGKLRESTGCREEDISDERSSTMLLDPDDSCCTRWTTTEREERPAQGCDSIDEKLACDPVGFFAMYPDL